MRCRYCFERCCVLLLFKDTATTEIYTTDTLFPYTTLFRSPKARRGDVRAAILSVLAEEAMNGYQVIQQIAERSEGAWKPSRSEEHTSELQSLMRISYAVFCLKKKKTY